MDMKGSPQHCSYLNVILAPKHSQLIAGINSDVMGDLVENGKNKLEVRCKHCESVVLKPQAADYIEAPVGIS